MFDAEVFQRQLKLQVESFGANPMYLEPEQRKFFVNNMALALITELGEALQEIPWKGWSTKQEFNRDAYLGELIDAGHFLINLFLIASDSLNDINSRYMMKATVNAQRQAEGYDESNKCEHCGRALDEPHATQLVLEYDGPATGAGSLTDMITRAQAAGFSTLSQYVHHLEKINEHHEHDHG